jgi:hypothetical protein
VGLSHFVTTATAQSLVSTVTFEDFLRRQLGAPIGNRRSIPKICSWSRAWPALA